MSESKASDLAVISSRTAAQPASSRVRARTGSCPTGAPDIGHCSGIAESIWRDRAIRHHLSNLPRGETRDHADRRLQILRRARLVEATRNGKRVLYSLAAEAAVIHRLQALGRVGERNVTEIERVMAAYFRARDELEPVSREDLVARQRDGLVTVLDVRPEDEFTLGHVPGALNVPLGALERRLAELSRDRVVDTPGTP